VTSTDTRSSGDAGNRGARVEPATTFIPIVGDGAEPPTTALPAQGSPKGPAPGLPTEGSGAFRWLSPIFALLAVALLPVAAATTNLLALDGWGLGRVLSPAGWASIVFAVAACVAELKSPRPRIPMLGTATGVLILCTTGMPSVVEPVARFATAWLIAGFSDAIAVTGHTPDGFDARFYWPAFFAQWAFFRDAGGATQLDTVLRWFPPAIVTVWTIGIYALARSMLGGTRAPWAAAWLFVGLNWIEQDYFSPQATGIVLMLTVLTFALGPLATRRTDAAGVPGWPFPHPGARRNSLLRRWLVAALTPPNRPTLPPRQLLLIYFCAALCLIAAAPEHQITPFAIIGQLGLLAVVGRFRGRGLVLVAILSSAVFILIAGREFWINQLGLIVGSGDQGALQAGVANRLTGDLGQVAVKYLRVLMPALTWLLGMAGAWVYWKRRRDLVPIGLAVVPMVFAAVQSYGGELILRIVLYGLPILSILGADALRALVRKRRQLEWVLAAGMVALFALLVIIRGGNDSFQVVFPQEVAMYRQTVADTPTGQTIEALSGVGPAGVVGIDNHPRADAPEGCDTDTDDVLSVSCLDAMAPDVVVSFLSIEKEGVYLYGKQPGWTLQTLQQLIATGHYTLTYQDGFDWVVRKIPQVDGG
jgi:hypothetical protein